MAIAASVSIYYLSNEMPYLVWKLDAFRSVYRGLSVKRDCMAIATSNLVCYLSNEMPYQVWLLGSLRSP